MESSKDDFFVYMANAPDYNAIYNQSLEQARNAAQPALESLQAQNPIIQKGYETTTGQIQGNQTADIGDTNTTLSREYGARGIPLSSGVFGQNLNQATSKIRNYYTGQLNQAGQQRDSALAQLQQQIAGLTSGYQQNAIQAAQGLYGQQLSAYNEDLNRQAQERQAAASRSAAAAQNSQQIAAQQQAYQQALALQNSNAAKQQQAFASSLLGPGGALAQSFGKTGGDMYVDKNEYATALQLLTQQGIQAQQAQSLLDQALQQGGYKKYGKY